MGNLDHWDHKNASVRLSRISEERNDFTHGVMFSMIRTYHHFELVLVAEFCDFFEGGDLKWSLTDRGLVDFEMWKGNKLGILTDDWKGI